MKLQFHSREKGKALKFCLDSSAASHTTYLLSEEIAGPLQWLFSNEVTGIGRYAINPISSEKGEKPAQTLSPPPLLPSSLKIPTKQNRAVAYKLLTNQEWQETWYSQHLPRRKSVVYLKGRFLGYPHTHILRLAWLHLAIPVEAQHSAEENSTAVPPSCKLKHLSLTLLGTTAVRGVY